MKTKRLSLEDLKDCHIRRKMVLFQKFDDPSVDMGVIEAIDENRIIMKTWVMSKVLYPLEDYVFYSLEVDDNDGD